MNYRPSRQRWIPAWVGLLSKFLTVVFCLPALAQNTPQVALPNKVSESIIKGFAEHLKNKQIVQFQKSLTLGPSIGELKGPSGDAMKVFSGGWNGSGGGGGLACFETEEAMKPWILPNGKAKHGWLDAIKNFQMLDLYDMEVQAEWPSENVDLQEFLSARIRERLEATMPVLSEALLANYNLAVNAIWFPMPTLSLIGDAGPLISGKPEPRNCIYGQWAERFQNSATQTAVYLIAYNESLDNRLKAILSPREYQIQKAVLVLHEAVYGALYHTGLRDAGYVRYLMNVLLMPDSEFKAAVISSANNGLFTHLWIGQILSVLVSTSQEFADYQNEKKIWSEAVSKQWEQYGTFLKKMDVALIKAAEFMQQNRMPPVSTYKAAIFGTREHQFFRTVAYAILASDWTVLTGQTAPRITNLEAFYLLANEFETQRRIESLQKLALSEPTSDEWKKACEQVKTQEATWKSAPESKVEDEKMFRGISLWIAQKAMRHCVEKKIIETSKETGP